ncbi:MAG: C39 family peptidase [Gammaproteobacteria bacterium]
MRQLLHSPRLRLWLAALLTGLSPLAIGGTVGLAGLPAGFVSVPVQSMQARKFATTIHQRYDYSCGSAALATLLTYQYHDPVTELTVFKAMWDHGNKAEIRRLGFSLLDIKHYLQAHGYRANGYRASLARLAKVGIPAIVLIRTQGYNHFVVIKGIEHGRVLVGDPSSGLRTVPIAQFKKMWPNRILFVIDNHRRGVVFDGKSDWALAPMAPLGTALGPSNLANVTLLRPGPNQF